MKKLVFYVLLCGSLMISLSDTHAAVLLHDDFNGFIISSRLWHIPVRKPGIGGTFIGRTQFRCVKGSALPVVQNGNAMITLESHDPTRCRFYGTDLISNKSFAPGQGIKLRVRAKMNTSTPGIVGGIFFYALHPRHSGVSDEIDFELLTNRPDEVRTNAYINGGAPDGDPRFVSYPSGSITGYHTYEIEWLPKHVSWFIDGRLVRTEKTNVPTGPMNLHLNLWAPDHEWAEAYSPKLIPVSSAGSEKVFSMSVDSVVVESISARAGAALAGQGAKNGPLRQD